MTRFLLAVALLVLLPVMIWAACEQEKKGEIDDYSLS
jgi:hypothetical protein